MSRPLVYRATGQENGVSTRRAAKRVSFASSTTPSRGPLTSRDVNVERRLPTPGKAPRKSIENDDLNESLSQAYATLRQQYDSLTAEMKQLRASPDKDKALKYQEVLAEKQSLEEELYEQRQLLNSLLTHLNQVFPDVLSDDDARDERERRKQRESGDADEETISAYVDSCIGTVAAQLQRDNEALQSPTNVVVVSGQKACSDCEILSSTPLQYGLPKGDGNEQSISTVIISPPSRFADNDHNTTDCPSKDQTPPPFNDSASFECTDTWSSCISTPSLAAPPSTPENSDKVSTPSLSCQLRRALISRLNSSSFTSRQSSSFASDVTPFTEETSLSVANEDENFALSFPSDCSPIKDHQQDIHDQSVQAVSSPIGTAEQGTEMMPVETMDQGISTSHVMMLDVSMETVPVETCTVATEMVTVETMDQGISTSHVMTCDVAVETAPVKTCSVSTEMYPPPVNPFQMKCIEFETQVVELRRELDNAQQQIEKLNDKLEEFDLQDSYKQCYYLELEKNRIFEEELATYHALVEKVEEMDKFHAELLGKTEQVKETMDKYREKTKLLNEECQLLEEQLANSHTKMTKLQRRESQLVTELGKLLVELTTVKSQLQVTCDELATKTEKAEKYECENEELVITNIRLKEELEMNNQAAVVAVETLQADVQRLEKELSEKCQELKNLTAQSGETQEFLEAERLTMCEELTILHSAARQSMFQQDTEMHAISGAVKLLWEKFHDTINVLSIRSGKETSQHLMALKRRKLLASESLVDRVLAGKMKKSLTSNSDEWGEETYVGYGHLMSRIVKLQEMVADLQDLASWKQLRDRIDVLDKEKSELNSELDKCQMRLQHSLKNLDETKQNLKRRDEQYMELEETIMGSRLEQELQRMKEKKQHYKDRLKELTGFGEEYQCHMERKVELLKSNLAKAEAEVQSLDHIVEHARKTLHVCHGVVKTNPKLEKLLHYLDGTTTVE